MPPGTLRPGAVANQRTAEGGVRMTWAIPSIVVAVVLLLAMPLWPWSRGWGWIPTGMVGVIAAIVWSITAVDRLAG